MCEEKRDFESMKAKAGHQRKRDALLVEQGRQHRENVAKSIVAGQSRVVGGPHHEFKLDGKK